MINKEMKAAELASVTGGGWKTNLAIGGLCLASGPIGILDVLALIMATRILHDKMKGDNNNN
ncbi:MAG: class IIb bacteriocin, lactobin A/cerein 7B family [Streptococcus sp.]